MIKTVNVALPTAAYPIHIGMGLLDNAQIIVEALAQPRVMVVTQEKIAALFLPRLSAALRQKKVDVQHMIIPDGEAYKNWRTLNHIFDTLLAAKCDRNTTLIALGGGMVGDITGFAAATFQRGVPLIQIPTTLLAQVDSSVGGKTAINHRLGKNMIGAFYQPQLVLADIATLQTLPARELSAGLAEVIKYGLINDLPFLGWLEHHIEQLISYDREKLAYAVARACRNKADIVAADEKETGVRALLNLGHTFGHAIEAGTGYGRWLHGEAVAVGLMMAAVASKHLGYLQQADVDRLRRLLQRARLPVSSPDFGLRRYQRWMQHDKKAHAGQVRFVLLKALGEAFIGELPVDVLAATLQETAAA